MTTPTIEQRARDAAEDLQRQAHTVSRESRAAIPDLERRVTLRRVTTAGVTVAVALIAALAWSQATQAPSPPLVSEGAEPTPQATSEAPPPQVTPMEYADGQILARPTPGDTVPPVSAEPNVDVCIGPPQVLDAVTLVVGPDAEAARTTEGFPLDSATGCIITSGHQQLRIAAHDGDYPAFTAELGGWRFRLAPGQAIVLDMTVDQYLERGAHQVESDFEPARAIVFWPRPMDPGTVH